MATSIRRPWLWGFSIGAAVLGVAVATALATGAFTQPDEPLTAVPPPAPSASPSAPAAPAEFAENTTRYDLGTLPVVDVFAIVPGLPVDDNPLQKPLALLATPRAPGAPLFADPNGQPVGHLPSQLKYDGTTVPVVERTEHWARILLSGRSGLPSTGVVGQLTAWVRTADVDLVDTAVSVRVDLTASSITVLDGETVTYQTGGFAWGKPETPTPIGRTFIMTTRVDPGAAYTRGHAIVYLAVQSPTLDGFDGKNNAITAFHYHDEREGAISNGCIRLGAADIETLAALPLGTPVVVYG